MRKRQAQDEAMCYRLPSLDDLRAGLTLILMATIGGTANARTGRQPEAGAVVSAHPLATQAGITILEAGGNACDASIATAAALAVVEPYSSGLGGGGFWLVHEAEHRRNYMIDARETAPMAVKENLYGDPQGHPVPNKSIDGPLAAGIPGLPAALDQLSQMCAKLPLKQSLAPAIALARNGFEVTPLYQWAAEQRLTALRAGGDAGRIFLSEGQVPRLGYRIVQKDLATTLARIADRGAYGFYTGVDAVDMVDGVRKAGGIWQLQDLATYQIKVRKPIVGHFGHIELVSAAPPSAGGIALLDALRILEPYRLERIAPTQRVHLVVEAMRRAYADRAQFLGDPDFTAIPTERLISRAHARQQRASISLTRATPSAELKNTVREPREGNNTTHFSILDRQGNRVAATLSINYYFGSAFVPPGTGVLLNDELDDFAIHRGAGNLYGLVGGEANLIGPRKRPLSSMTPTFLQDDTRLAILGTPGGSRITTMVLLAALDFAAGSNPNAWVSRPRFHHQYLPDRIEYEPDAFTSSMQMQLRQRGHALQPVVNRYGNMQAILWNKRTGRVQAASDPRGEGSAAFTADERRPGRTKAGTLTVERK